MFEQIPEHQIIDIILRAANDGRLPFLRTDMINGPITEDVKVLKDVYLARGKRLYFDTTLEG